MLAALSRRLRMHTTPLTLLERVRQSTDQAAWSSFVALYTPLLLYWARRSGLQEHDAADVVQEVFVILVRKLPEFQYDPQQSFRGWLRTVLLNCCRSRFKKRTEVVPGGELPAERTAPDDSTLFTEAEYHTWLVARAVELLQAEFEPTTWKASWETLVNGRPAPDVAAELQISVNAVYLAKARVLSKLRRELDGLWD